MFVNKKTKIANNTISIGKTIETIGPYKDNNIKYCVVYSIIGVSSSRCYTQNINDLLGLPNDISSGVSVFFNI